MEKGQRAATLQPPQWGAPPAVGAGRCYSPLCGEISASYASCRSGSSYILVY